MKDVPFNYCKDMLLQLDDLDTLLDFREQTLRMFEKYFHLERSIFWLCNSEGEIYSPVTRNTSQKALGRYITHYSREDFLLPVRVFPLLAHKRVLTIEEVVTKHEYEASRFYNEFMKPNSNYHEMGVYLISKSQLIGGISFVGEQHHPFFNRETGKSLDLLSHFLSTKLHYILKHPSQYGQLPNVKLTPGEEKVCELLQMGWTNQEMVDQLFVSVHTVKKHLQNIYRKSGVTNRTSLLSLMIYRDA